MNRKAAVFACRITGVTGLLLSLLLAKTAGIGAVLIGVAGFLFWIGLGRYFGRSA
jgi:hypothetical protein